MLDLSARFCANCGLAVASTAPSDAARGAGERRRLTILFCDLVGSTALSEELDPEDLGELVLAYQEMGRAVVTDFGGHVAQYLGDGLLAYFGYPTAHEDDAERAVLAGRAILAGLEGLNQQTVTGGKLLEARVGIHAGPTIVGELGSADRSDTSAFGSTPNIAARLEGVAAPHTVVVSDEVRKFLDSRFELRDLGSPTLKGVSRPLRAWEVTRVGDRQSRLATRSHLPMFGRDEERAKLLEALAAAEAGRPQLVVVQAEPGVGKTRLLQALNEHVQGRDATSVWLEGQCSELTAATPLAPVVQFLAHTLGLDGASDEERPAKVLEALAVLGEGAEEAASYVGVLVGVEIEGAATRSGRSQESPELQRRKTLDWLTAWVRALAADRTVVVVVEDVHWSDPTTLELLELLTGEGARVLCVCTSRNETELSWRSPDRVSTIALSPLGADVAEELTRALAVGQGLTAEAVDAIAQRSDGVPLFIEELVSVATHAPDLGESATAVPPTLQALLTSRLDLLGDARRVAQAAAVLGREFPRALLAVVADLGDDELALALERLVTAGIVFYRPSATGAAYVFRHALIQDAAYDSLLRRHRRALHSLAADALMSRFADLVPGSPEVVARHLQSADRRLEAGAWFETAGRRAAERAALREARAHFEQGIALLEDLEGSEEERARQMTSLLVLLGNALMGSSGIGHDVARPVWEQAIEYAERVGDGDAATAALNGLAVYHADRGDLVATEECVDRTLAIAARDESRIAELRGLGTRGMVRLYQGRGEEARQHLLDAAALSREGDFFTVTFGIGHDQETFFLTMNAWASWWLGRPDEGLGYARRGLELAERLPSSLTQVMARHALALTHLLRSEPAEAAAVARTNIEMATAFDFPFWRGLAGLELGAAMANLGDEHGLSTIHDSLDRLTSIGNVGGSTLGMVLLADACQSLRHFDEALEAVETGLAMSALLGQPFCDTELWAARGRALLELGRETEGVVALEESLATGRSLGAASATLRTAVSYAPRLARTDPNRARDLLGEALAAMHDGFDTNDQRAARARLEELMTRR